MPSTNQRKLSSTESVCIHHKDVHCTTFFAHPDSEQGLHTPHQLSSTSKWLTPNDYLCWHCAHPFDNVPVYVPQSIIARSCDDPIFQVYGNFCSFGCAKAFIMGNHNFDSSKQIMLLNKMAIDVYGILLPIVHSPPRICLKAFGGNMSIESFRAANKSARITCQLPPFAASSVMIKTCQTSKKSEKKQKNSTNRKTYNENMDIRDINEHEDILNGDRMDDDDADAMSEQHIDEDDAEDEDRLSSQMSQDGMSTRTAIDEGVRKSSSEDDCANYTAWNVRNIRRPSVKKSNETSEKPETTSVRGAIGKFMKSK